MSSGRIFTDEELRELGGMPTHELILAAIDAGDKEKAKELTLRLYNDSQRLLDMYVYWTTSLLSYIGRRNGDEAIQEAQVEFFTISAGIMQQKEQSDAQAGEDGIRQLVQAMASSVRGAFSQLEIQEDDEKFILQMKPCGTGGRMILEGIYEKFGFIKIKKAQPMTFGQEDFPVYCTHCACAAISEIEAGDVPGMFLEASEKPGEKLCNFYIYKDPKAFPAELYAKVGKEKKALPKDSYMRNREIVEK
ncbi:MAG: hypothetical protein FP814_01835 [Desulfobacterium sp.]|nr:hypothetical protein [Desulfobacterium sp.]MBU3948209.1 hypothetical protein [Pseudomonadota bacterium]MBU4011029.1 hypothetical protein [Pseudomonadota bacterium]MBU4035555.1 hypothetical protein [Pseudomonadota bacterium]